jgi:hypothetical protein
MQIDICFRTTAASHNPHVQRVSAILRRFNVYYTGQYRDDTHYALYSSPNTPVPQAAIDEICALDIPERSVEFKVWTGRAKR